MNRTKAAITALASVLAVTFALAGAACAEDLPPTPYLSAFEREVVQELNLARTQPKTYTDHVAKLLPHYRENNLERPGRVAVRTQEGRAAAEEAVNFLRWVKPVAALKPSRGMSMAAEEHVLDLGRTGDTGHEGSDGSQSWERLNRYGEWRKRVGENIDFGSRAAREVVISLLIDDGVSSRGHRKNIFRQDFRAVGVGCSEHARYGSACVIDFAAEYIEGSAVADTRRE